MRNWNTIDVRKVDQFEVELAWTYEETALRDMFDDTIFDIEDMQRRCEDYTDTHYVARVRVMYDGVEMGCSTLGSCYARDCDPAEDMLNGLDDYLEQMTEEALDEARAEAVRMLDRLKADFLN